MSTPRYAIYYAPATDSQLWQSGSDWLAGTSLENWPGGTAPSANDFAAATQSARRYGFHATLKAPMRLAEPYELKDLAEAVESFSIHAAPVEIGRLELRSLGGFLALLPTAQTDQLSALAAKIVTHFEPFRSPMTEAERDKRVAAGLTEHQLQLLGQYGYPYVMDEFRLHFTLTDRLPADQKQAYFDAAQRWFSPALETRHTIDRLAIYAEPAPGAPFARVLEFELKGAPKGEKK